MDKVSARTAQSQTKDMVRQLLLSAGIVINGKNPWDIHVHNEDFYARVLNAGALGLGESYMDKWWDSERVDLFIEKIILARLDTKISVPIHFNVKQLLSKIINYQSKERAQEVAYRHYDLDNELFKCMLDKYMVYSCGYWKEATTLDDAQVAKLDLICQKLQLQPGQTLLDIGCGWGGLAKYAAENYGVTVTGVTISKQQYDFATAFCEGLPVNIYLKDYRDITETFDRIVSIGMFEHVGPLNYSAFMHTVHNALKSDGLFLLHTIGMNETDAFVNEWTLKYIFPNGSLPSIALIATAAEKLLVMEDWQNFGAYYDTTLMAWHTNFTNHWPQLSEHYDERFYRMWTYYLLSCAGSFRARDNQLWQIVFSKHGIRGGYLSPR